MISFAKINEFDGEIQFGGDVLTWKFDDTQQCCEYFGSNFDQIDHEIVGKTVESYDLVRSYVDPKKIYKEYEKEYIEYSLVALFTDKTRLEIIFFNAHSSQYDHNLDVYLNGTIKWNIAF